MARPSKRRQQATAAQTVATEQFTVVHKTAIYARLSREDNLNQSDSIENQLALLHDYVDCRPFLQLVGTFIDNGYTGTDFERPEWQKLMEAVQAKEVDCIVVKDLSRLGRNYIETGEFLEKICPFFGIRFIAINDGFDTDTVEASGQLSVSLSNIINDYYAKDISRKVSSALRSKMENGEFIGAWEKYGYLKDPNNKNQLIINPETAPIMKLVRSFSTKKDKVYFTFKCPTYAEHGTRACNAKKMRKADLDEAVLATIKAQLDLFVDMQGSLHQLLAMKKAMAKQSGQKDEIKSLKKKLDHKKGLFGGLYRDLREGLISDEDYVQTREVILDEINRLEKQLSELEGTTTRFEEQAEIWQLLKQGQKEELPS